MSALPVIVATALLLAYCGLCAVKLYALWKLSQIRMPEPTSIRHDCRPLPIRYGSMFAPPVRLTPYKADAPTGQTPLP